MKIFSMSSRLTLNVELRTGLTISSKLILHYISGNNFSNRRLLSDVLNEDHMSCTIILVVLVVFDAYKMKFSSKNF